MLEKQRMQINLDMMALTLEYLHKETNPNAHRKPKKAWIFDWTDRNFHYKNAEVKLDFSLSSSLEYLLGFKIQQSTIFMSTSG